MEYGDIGTKGLAKVSETRFKRTWFGATARVTINPGFLHKAGFGSVVIPHPPVANRLLRQGLPEEPRRRLTFSHEFAHFQTAPVLFVYLLAVLFFAGKERTCKREIFLLLPSMHAAWEIMAEGLVVLEDSRAYHAAYKRITKLPRILFWTAGGMLAASAWVVVLRG